MLMEAQPGNRMAFDYSTAWVLLHKNLGDVSADIERYRQVGYASIPTHCQEALLLHARLQGVPVDAVGFSYDPTIATRVAEFLEALRGYQERPEAPALSYGPHGGTYMSWRPEAPARLYGAYGGTYMFYLFFAAPPTDQPEGAPLRTGATRQE